MNFQKALGQADKLEELADQILSEVNGAQGERIRNLSGCWKGDNAERYQEKGCELLSKTEKRAEMLKEAANSIRTIARTTYRAEMRALELAKVRI